MATPINLERLGFTEHYASDTRFLLPPTASVPVGPVLLGSDPQRDPHAAIYYELPQHIVELASFLIGIFPVTVAEYACAVRSGAVREPPPAMHVIFNWELQLQHPTHPVTCVTWQDAVAYCAWLGSVSGSPWRLPTEAEWEKAARGAEGQIYPWGDEPDAGRTNTDETGHEGIVPIDAYLQEASPYGVHGMVGNVWEWCSSLAKPYPYRPDDGREDHAALGRRVLRGGSFAEPLSIARAAFRYDDDPDFPLSHAGFRLARDAKPMKLT